MPDKAIIARLSIVPGYLRSIIVFIDSKSGGRVKILKGQSKKLAAKGGIAF